MMNFETWTYAVSEKAQKQLRSLDRQEAKRILKFLKERVSGSENPRLLGKRLKGDLNNIWRYRVGEYRILCQIQDKDFVVLVLQVGSRKNIYRD